MRFFERKDAVTRAQLPDPRLQIFFGLLLGATVFGSLWAIADEGGSIAATLITTGIAISVLPILMRGLPSLARDAATRNRDPNYRVTAVGLVLYAAVVGGIIAVINID